MGNISETYSLFSTFCDGSPRGSYLTESCARVCLYYLPLAAAVPWVLGPRGPLGSPRWTPVGQRVRWYNTLPRGAIPRYRVGRVPRRGPRFCLVLVHRLIVLTGGPSEGIAVHVDAVVISCVGRF